MVEIGVEVVVEEELGGRFDCVRDEDEEGE